MTPTKHGSRLAIVETLYYQQEDAQPISHDHRFSKPISSSEQAYLRLTFVGEEWQKVDTGWVKECSVIIIKNESGKFSKIPTEDKKEAESKKVLEISIVPHSSPAFACIIIPPQESARFTPKEISCLKIRCAKGESRYTIIAVPL
jgi:hypothetical protein